MAHMLCIAWVRLLNPQTLNPRSCDGGAETFWHSVAFFPTLLQELCALGFRLSGAGLE